MTWTLHGSTSVPADPGTNAANGTNPIVLTPPAAMAAGDLVWVRTYIRDSTRTFAVDAAGGQTWTTEAASNRSALNASQVFWCVFNGTWGANPSFSASVSSVLPFSAVMHVFRHDGGGTPTVDVAQVVSGAAAPGTPFDHTITGVTTLTDDALVIASFACSDDVTWTLQTGGWTNAGSAQYRNDAGSDCSLSTAYQVKTTAGATGNVTNRMSLDAVAVFTIQAWKPVSAGVADLIAANSTATQGALAGQPVPTPPSVIVTDGGVPMVGDTVTFSVATGGGSMSPADGIVLTNGSGVATLTSWTTGGTVGSNTVSATTGVAISGDPVVFTAHTVAAPAGGGGGLIGGGLIS